MNKSPHGQLSERNDKAGNFIRDWISSNVYNVPGMADLPREIERLAAQITGDARQAGISGGDLARAVGDIDDFLTGAYENLTPGPVNTGTA